MKHRNGAGESQDSGKRCIFLTNPLPSSQLKMIVGARKTALALISEKLHDAFFDVVKGQIVIKSSHAEAMEKRYKGFKTRVISVFAFLERRTSERPGYKIQPADIDEALAYAEDDVKKTGVVLKMIPFTSDRLTPQHLETLRGPNDINLRQIGQYFKGIELSVSEGNVVADVGMLNAVAGDDQGFRLRLQTVLTSLEGVVLAGGTIDESNIKQACELALESQKAALKGVARFTDTGKQTSLETKIIEEMKDSYLFDSRVLVETCPDDPHFVPTQTITFTKDGRTILGLMMSGDRVHADRIRDKLGVTLFVDKEKLILRGQPEATESARNVVIAFANLLAEKGYKKKDVVAHALSVVLGEVEEGSLPPTEEGKKKNKGGGPKNKYSEYAAFFSKLSLLMSAGRTPNQERYIKLIEDKKYPLVLTQGPAGTGKTFLFLQRAMREICNHYIGVPGAAYDKIVLSYPLVNTGKTKTGFLPGGVFEKTKGKFRTYYDHFQYILAPRSQEGFVDEMAGKAALDYLMEEGIVQIELLEDMMGKSYRNAIVALDEAQNAKSEQMTSLLTRPEETSRLFVFGDMEQCYLGSKQAAEGGERYDVPRNIRIDEKGMVYIKKNGQEMALGLHRDVGSFVMDRNGLQYVTPYNGLTEAFLLYSESPLVACVSLDHCDVQRSSLAKDILTIRRALRVVGDDLTGQAPRGKGHRCVKSVLKGQDSPQRPFGTVVPLDGARHNKAG